MGRLPSDLKRRLGTIGLFLSFGAVVNIAIAWLLFYINGIGDDSQVTYRNYGPEFLVVSGHFRSVGFTEFSYNRIRKDPNWPDTISLVLGYNERLASDIEETLIPQVRMVDGRPSPQNFVSVGWPLRTLYATDHHRFVNQLVVPYVPMLGGLVVNTVFYAVLLWGLAAAPVAVRRALRRRRGLCERCAYPIGASAVCTECGVPVRREPIE